MQENNHSKTNQNSSPYEEAVSGTESDTSKNISSNTQEDPNNNIPNNIPPMYGNNQQNTIQQNNNIPPMYGNNQQNYNQQWGYNNQPIQNQPPLNQKPKKNEAAVFVGILAAVAAVLIIVLAVIFSKSLFKSRNPHEQVKKGMKNMLQEMEAYTSSISEDIGTIALEKLRKSTPIRTGMDFSFTIPYEEFSGLNNISIGMDAITDIEKHKAMYDFSVGAYGFKMSVADIITKDNTMYVEIPILLDDVYSIDFTNFGRDFNRSAWSDFLGLELPEDQEYTFFDTTETETNTEYNKYGAELRELIKKYTKMLTDATQYKALSQQREFKVGEKTVSCKGIAQIVDKDAFNEMISDMNKDIRESNFYTDILTNEEFREEVDKLLDKIESIQIEQDFVLDYYLDNKGRIVNISTPEDIVISGSSINAMSVDLNFTGEKRTLDAIEGGFYFQAEDTVLYFGIEREASVTDKMYSEQFSILLQDDRHTSDITFRYWNDWDYENKSYDMWMTLDTMDSAMTFCADGRFFDIVKGERYTFRVNNATLNIDGADLIIISGTVKVEPTDEEIEIPEGAIDLFEMDERDIQELLYDLMMIE